MKETIDFQPTADAELAGSSADDSETDLERFERIMSKELPPPSPTESFETKALRAYLAEEKGHFRGERHHGQ